MTQIVLPYRPIAGDPEDISQLLANYDAILNVVNGGLQNDNIAANAAIAASKLQAIPGSNMQMSRGTTPPASPADGDLWQFAADAAAGIYWLFRYNLGSASTYKWEFIGGAPLEAVIAASAAVSGAGWIDIGGPQVTLPRAGDYRVALGTQFSAVPNVGFSWSAGVGFPTNPVDPHIVSVGGPASAATFSFEAWKAAIKTGVAAATVAKIFYTYVNFAPNVKNRILSVLPVRVS